MDHCEPKSTGLSKSSVPPIINRHKDNNYTQELSPNDGRFGIIRWRIIRVELECGFFHEFRGQLVSEQTRVNGRKKIKDNKW
ncbi:hypothetical protein KEM48_008238 [Puccinia striiformis f. sp. tritici PST-130]|nr:hypothetical protein KEM48_008238 [Puccinia striiformis f. sp. tritici PST-130]